MERDARSSKKAETHDPEARRALLGTLLGGLGAAVLSGCVAKAESEVEALGEAAQALGSGTNFAIVDTIADLRTIVGTTAIGGAGSAPTTVIVQGYTNPLDGGGGVFTWIADATTPDDRGTFIVPSATPRTGCWRRLYAGALNVRWFGARGDGQLPGDEGAFQAAINAATAKGGGVVFIPAGDYCIAATVNLPKTFGGQPVPISLVGEGPALGFTASTGRRNGSCLRWASTDSQAPMLSYSATDNADVYNHTIENLLFVRGDGFGVGTIFLFPYSPNGANGNSRWRACAIKNCHFTGNPGDSVATLVRLYGAWNTVIEDVMMDGGNIGLYSSAGSRLQIIGFQTSSKGTTNHAILIDGGDSHVIQRCRFEGCNGTLIKITGGAINVSLDSISTEGWREPVQIDLDDVKNARLSNLNMGGPDFAGTFIGVRVGAACNNVTIRGGFLGGTPAIKVEPGVKHLHVEDVVIDDAQANVIIEDDSASPSKTKDVVIRCYEHPTSPIYAFTFTRGVYDPVQVSSQPGGDVMLHKLIYDLAGRDTFCGASVTGRIDGIERGCEGQRLTVLLSAPTTFTHAAVGLPATAAPLRLSGGVNAALQANAVLQLLYNGGAWYEVGRSVNG